MKLSNLFLAATLGLASVSAFANWQPYVGVGVNLSNNAFTTNVSNPPLFVNYHQNGGLSFIDSNAGQSYKFNSNANQVSPQLQIGIANQYNKYYVGFEADLDLAYSSSQTQNSNSITDTITYLTNSSRAANQVTSAITWESSLTTQLGYFVTQKIMPYVKVGVATANTDMTYNFTTATSAPGFSTHATPWLFGPTASLGVQYSINTNLRVFAEGNYTELWGSATPTGTLAAGNPSNLNAPTPFKQDYTLSSWTIKLGTNYYF